MVELELAPDMPHGTVARLEQLDARDNVRRNDAIEFWERWMEEQFALYGDVMSSDWDPPPPRSKSRRTHG